MPIDISNYLPERIRITQADWTESRGAYEVQLGDENQTIAYAWVPCGIGDRLGVEKAMAIAERICELWNT